MAAAKATAEEKVSRFNFTKLLSQGKLTHFLSLLAPSDQAGRRVSLLGSIDGEFAILIVERAAFSIEASHLQAIVPSLANVRNLGANDIYSWFLANQLANGKTKTTQTGTDDIPADLKLNIIHPCTEKHIAKYSSQSFRVVTETPEIYRLFVRPFMERQRLEGRLNWVFNIIEGRSEQEDVIFREHAHGGIGVMGSKLDNGGEGFLLLPDLNWDRKTLTSLHLLALVERRDIWSLRDLRKSHISWLKTMERKIMSTAISLYPGIQEDQLKLYVHYQPTYYHFHIHVVHVMLESGSTQAVGKALGLSNIVAWLESMEDTSDQGMSGVDLVYHLGEASELWREVFKPLKEGKTASIRG